MARRPSPLRAKDAAGSRRNAPTIRSSDEMSPPPSRADAENTTVLVPDRMSASPSGIARFERIYRPMMRTRDIIMSFAMSYVIGSDRRAPVWKLM